MFCTRQLMQMSSAQASLSIYNAVTTPTPLLVDAPQQLFSEGRAMQHVKHLADTIGERLVSTAGEEEGAQYLLAEAEKLVALAQQRPDLIVEAVREQVCVSVCPVCQSAWCVCERKWMDGCRAQKDGNSF
jgi:hypothetical protein